MTTLTNADEFSDDDIDYVTYELSFWKSRWIADKVLRAIRARHMNIAKDPALVMATYEATPLRRTEVVDVFELPMGLGTPPETTTTVAESVSPVRWHIEEAEAEARDAKRAEQSSPTSSFTPPPTIKDRKSCTKSCPGCKCGTKK